MKPVRIGCSGWNYADWRERVYPKGLPATRWLEYYATLFDTVEVNSTFYRLPRREAVARWVEQTPPEFVFAVKASQYLTHFKRLTDLDRGVQRFYNAIAPLAESPKLGPVLWQLPERFTRDVPRLAAALDALPRGRHAFEFRHESWFTDAVLDLLRWHGVALAIGHHPARPWQPWVTTTDWSFVRFHYGRGRRGNYSESELRQLTPGVGELAEAGDVFAFFNNDWEAFAVRNALRLRRLLEGAGVDVTAPRRGVGSPRDGDA
ncbi:MAG TPA: DUF72 domain-containing protein [Solirubrobacteraceae bacterium]|nr:DUF72 domain-containing protein [Solirubrobacteraceae bacterium]